MITTVAVLLAAMFGFTAYQAFRDELEKAKLVRAIAPASRSKRRSVRR